MPTLIPPMKRTLLLLGALLAASLAPAAPAPVNSAISAVTVYTDRAVVTRTARLDLPGGITELVFANLPQALNERSLQVSGKGTAQAVILDVSARQTYVDFTPNTRVKELEDILRGLQKQLHGLDDRNSVLQAQSAILDKMEAALFAPPAKDVPRPNNAAASSPSTPPSMSSARTCRPGSPPPKISSANSAAPAAAPIRP
jgi:hypothetical protein